MRRLLIATALLVGTAASAKGLLGKGPGFDVYSSDDQGGGWVVHRTTGRGDTLWGCQDVGSVESCTQVHFNAWKTGAKLKVFHVSKDSLNAWVVLSVAGDGDHLLSCTGPEDAPACTEVMLDKRPGTASYKRVWPAMDCVSECGMEGCCDTLPEDDPRRLLEDAAKADMWMQVGPKIPGASSLYACTGLGADPKCVPAVPNWLAYDRENIGFKKLEDIETEGADGEVVYGPGVTVGKIDEESVAFEAGFREGDVILKVGEYEVNLAKHARNLFLQYPAEAPIQVTKGDGTVVELIPRRKPKKK
jgi:hypothetical protein